uniref:BRCT domain-containing protein n=1 Tax=Salix viminalis TaxID=40686 RepID=A0A6N2M806_SALVM
MKMGTCRRTLKVLKGILKGTWIVNIEWVKACIKSMKLVEEMRYEITADVHGIRDGPRNWKTKSPEQDFIPSYKGYIQDLLVTGGGTILHRKPISGVQETLLLDSKPPTFIIYSLEVPDKCGPSKKKMILTRRQSAAEALASSTGAKAVSNKWVLNSIAACKLQSLAK